MWQNLYDRITEMTAWQSLSNVRRLRIGRITTSNFYDVVPCKFGKSKTLLNKLMNYVHEVFFMEEKWKQEPKKSYTTLVMTGGETCKTSMSDRRCLSGISIYNLWRMMGFWGFIKYLIKLFDDLWRHWYITIWNCNKRLPFHVVVILMQE